MTDHSSKHIVVYRLSALGDVAMAAVVIKEVLKQNPDLTVTMVSHKSFAGLFMGIDRLQFLGVDKRGKHSGILGLYKLFKEIKEFKPIAFADLHGVIRSYILGFLFSVSRMKVAKIGKGRTAKNKLVRRNNKVMKALKPSFQRYADVFTELDLTVELENQLVKRQYQLNQKLRVYKNTDENLIGIAPFARHKAKRMPFEKAEAVIEALSQLPNCRVLLFGGGQVEEEKLMELADGLDSVDSVAGKLSMADELDLMSRLSVMVSMDSANMHLASLAGTPVVSVWGATHPYAGFLGYGQSFADTVQDDIECRPCSVFGNKVCWRGDYACLHNIDPQEILVKVSKKLTEQKD